MPPPINRAPLARDLFGGAEASGEQEKMWMVGTRPTMTTFSDMDTGAKSSASRPAFASNRDQCGFTGLRSPLHYLSNLANLLSN
jgi:hypothetical protein